MAKHDTKRNARTGVRKTLARPQKGKNVSFFLLVFPSQPSSLHSDAIEPSPHPIMSSRSDGRRSRRSALAPPLLPLAAAAVLMLFCAGGVGASIHEYSRQGFTPKLNSFFFHGGSEGLYASRPPAAGGAVPGAAGKSYISCVSLFFVKIVSFFSLKPANNRVSVRACDWVSMCSFR